MHRKCPIFGLCKAWGNKEGTPRDILSPNSGSPHNGAMLFLILIFATITGLAALYSHLLQECMAATCGRSRRLIAREEDGAELWTRRCCNYDLRRLGMHGGERAGDSKARREVLGGDFLELQVRELQRRSE